MSGTLLAYGDKVIGVVAKDNGSVSITADGVKTYNQLFDALFALIDLSKISHTSCLVEIGASYTNYFPIAQMPSSSRIRVSNVIITNTHSFVKGIEIRSSGSTYYQSQDGATPTNEGASIPTSSTVIKFIY